MLILTHQQQTAVENIVGKEEIARLQYKSFENTVGKEGIDCYEQFSFSHRVL